MVIHKIIKERRVALGLTQEQMAEYLGVTPPAVNKWEKGSTCPDIALLPPLARILKIDLNTLFGFYEDITEQELIIFCKEISETASSKGFEAGFLVAQEKIRQFPNSDTLLHNVALQLQHLLVTSGLEEEQKQEYLKKIHQWFERLTLSDEVVIRNSALFMLASCAINDEKYDKAQEYLDIMPNRNDTPDKRMLQADIYLKQNQVEEAAKLLEQMLITTINDVQMVLYKLIDVNIALGDNDGAAYVAGKVTTLSEIFDLNPYNAIVAQLMVAMEKKNPKETVALLRKMFDSMSTVWSISNSPLYGHVKTNETGATMEKMIGPFIRELKESTEYKYLQSDDAFWELVAEFEGNKIK